LSSPQVKMLHVLTHDDNVDYFLFTSIVTERITFSHCICSSAS